MTKPNTLEEQALRCNAVASELELAAKHMRTMADHFRSQEVARAGAHSLAAQGHIEKARLVFADIAVNHAAKAIP